MAKESRSHAPGSEAHDGGMRQHQSMAQGRGIGERDNFGVGPIPGLKRIEHPDGPPSAKMLSDSERAGPPNFKTGSSEMHATHHSDHGPHLHPHAIHHAHMPKGNRPHHVK